MKLFSSLMLELALLVQINEEVVAFKRDSKGQFRDAATVNIAEVICYCSILKF